MVEQEVESEVRPNVVAPSRLGGGGAQVAHSSAHDQRDAELVDFHIRILSTDCRSIVHVSGELDSYTAARLRDS